MSSLNPSTVGQQVTFTAVVSQGVVRGADGDSDLHHRRHTVNPGLDRPLRRRYEAEFTTSALSVGRHQISATYGGDSNFASSSSPSPLVQAVAPIPTAISLSTSAQPAIVGETVIFTATVNPSAGSGAPTGVVTLIIDGTYKATASLKQTAAGDRAVFEITTLTAGKHSVSASYGGDAADSAGSLVTPLTQIVAAAAPADPSVVAAAVTQVQRFGIHMQPTVIVVSFSANLDATSAVDRHNYLIVSPRGERLGIKSATYSSLSDTVTIRPKGRIDLHRNYRFTVKGAGSAESQARISCRWTGTVDPERTISPRSIGRMSCSHRHKPSSTARNWSGSAAARAPGLSAKAVAILQVHTNEFGGGK